MNVKNTHAMQDQPQEAARVAINSSADDDLITERGCTTRSHGIALDIGIHRVSHAFGGVYV